jgi:hypothetical protein
MNPECVDIGGGSRLPIVGLGTWTRIAWLSVSTASTTAIIPMPLWVTCRTRRMG